MAQYTSSYTGAQIDAALEKANNALPKTGGTLYADLSTTPLEIRTATDDGCNLGFVNAYSARLGWIGFSQDGNPRVILANASRYRIWHEGNLTNLNQFINGPGYINGISDEFSNTAPSLGSLDVGTVRFAGKYNGNILPYGMYYWEEATKGLNCLQCGYTNGTASKLPLCLQPLGGSIAINKGGTTAPSYQVEVGGTVAATAFTQTSDIRKKDIVEDAKNLEIDTIADAPLFKYQWKDKKEGEEVYIGSSAQYWKNIVPEAVSQAKDEIGTLSMQYDIIAFDAVVSMAKELRELKLKVKELEEKLNKD